MNAARSEGPKDPTLPPFRIRRAGPECIDALEPLWAAMLAHHETIAPRALVDDIVGFRSRADAWARRRARYEEWFADGCALLHVAESGPDGLVGYALVRIVPASAQLAVPEPAAELESLSVARAFRGQGIGSRLIGAVHDDLRARGIEILGVTVFAGNDDAARLYARHGMRPALSRMLGRVPPAS